MTVAVDNSKCIGCGACIVECPIEALDLIDGIAVVNPKICDNNGKCVLVCPTNALALNLPDQANKPTQALDPEAGARFDLKDPLPDTVKDYAQDNQKKTIPAQVVPVAGGDVWSGVWVIIEYTNGKVAPVSWELLGEGRKLADAIGCGLSGVITGHQVDSVIPEAFAYGAERVYVVDHPVLKDYRTEPYAEAITSLVTKYQPEIILMGATSMGRDVFPAIATRVQTGLTADCTVLGIDPETKLLQQTRPAFGGNIMATILCRSSRPQMATVRPRVMAMPERVDGREGELIHEEILFDETNIRTKVLEFISSDAKSAFLDKAEIIVAVGLGLAAKRNMVLAEELAEVLGATIAGSRGAVEAGWLTHDQQVGQSGVTVRPKVYIAIGISGAIQHLVGMETSDFIIAINNDPEASILKVANYGIVGDLFQIVPALTAEFKKRLQHGVAN
ncbi:FAD-binding protein [Desulfosporosinus sp. BICA1-9]|uniref:FAD-binding protein n=2 Tax=Desulfosporosinus sp. BICA1-9 TaxID=1531958 RepID=UPI00054B3D65|nr:FAD-binding protein [Desulfosporosinus sp. BICA1-9]KJS48163.1 MAG: electron transfer flavoprotein subunit alpha [Peptococcaceae bacterium BRH_c23]KJS83195.1 MAG: electron transfer flavoprotein subunit alpha [Desulfosporosinus sp. BICA1-9]HBW34714.1 electron transfer flavoprotein subunit alpha [Desulfosporosinus sp.]